MILGEGALFARGLGATFLITLAVVACMTLGFGYLLVVPVLSITQAVMYHSLKKLQGSSSSF